MGGGKTKQPDGEETSRDADILLTREVRCGTLPSLSVAVFVWFPSG